MTYLLTGASGYLGNIIIHELKGLDIITLARRRADIIADLSMAIPSLPSVDCIIHAAGKAHMVPSTLQESREFFNVNVTGTSNLLKGIEQAPNFPKTFVYISSVAVYGCQAGTQIDENHRLNAKDPYGLSKIEAELLIRTWCSKHSITCTILRLPLIAGPNPPGNLGAMIKGIDKGYYFNIGGGKAKKSMVLASDVAKVIPSAATTGGIYNLTDGYHPAFYEISRLISTQLKKNMPRSLPLPLAQLLGKVGDFGGRTMPINSSKIDKIVSDLTFDDSNARKFLGWAPRQVLQCFKISENRI